MLERKIIIGCINETTYLKQVRGAINPKLIELQELRLIIEWSISYYDRFNKAPGTNIQEIYFQKIKQLQIPDDTAELIETMLTDISKQAEHEEFDLEYMIPATIEYFKNLKLVEIKNTLDFHLEKGDVDKAEQAIHDYTTIVEKRQELDLSSNDLLDRMRKAFTDSSEPLVEFPGALGELWNQHFIRGGFVAFLAPEKRGKSALLSEVSMRAGQQNRNVVVIQAGDMTEAQWLKRLGIYVTRKSDKPKHKGNQYLPIRDCIKNQLDTCNKKVRECDYGVFDEDDITELQDGITMEKLIEAYEQNKDYRPCYNCEDWMKQRLGAVWVEKKNLKILEDPEEAVKKAEKFFVKKKRSIRLLTYPSDTLTVREIDAILSGWEDMEDWKADVIIIDYADLLTVEGRLEERHKHNAVWKQLRALSISKDCLVVTATQADAGAYEKDTLTLKNYSEDKRKYAHVTAFYALNQDKKGREKKIGLLRISELILREDSFDTETQVTILQGWKIGRPIIGSYFSNTKHLNENG